MNLYINILAIIIIFLHSVLSIRLTRKKTIDPTNEYRFSDTLISVLSKAFRLI